MFVIERFRFIEREVIDVNTRVALVRLNTLSECFHVSLKNKTKTNKNNKFIHFFCYLPIIIVVIFFFFFPFFSHSLVVAVFFLPLLVILFFFFFLFQQSKNRHAVLQNKYFFVCFLSSLVLLTVLFAVFLCCLYELKVLRTFNT